MRCFIRDVLNIESGIGDKMGNLIQWTATFIAGYTVSLVLGWKVALVMASLMPIMVAAFAVVGMVIRLTNLIIFKILIYTKMPVI